MNHGDGRPPVSLAGNTPVAKPIRHRFFTQSLVFEVPGDEWRSDRDHFFSTHTFRFVPDPRVVVVATRDIPAGDPVYQRWTTLSIASASEAGSDALTYVPDVRDSVAAVPISKGQPITPGLLEPPA